MPNALVWTFIIVLLPSVHSLLAPGQLFDLSNFYLQLPTCVSPCSSGDVNTVYQPALNTYSSTYFSTNPDNSINLWCPVTGVHTSGSEYPRTELREVQNLAWNNDGNGDWTFKGYHQLNVTMKVNVQPPSKSITIGQIHGQSIGSTYVEGSCSIIVEFEWNNGQLVNNYRGPPSGSDASSATCTSHSQTLPGTYSLGEEFEYSLVVSGNDVSIWTSKGGWTTPYSYSWFTGSQTYWMYFKVGDYVQDNTGTSSLGGKISIYSLKTVHSETVPEAKQQAPAPKSAPKPAPKPAPKHQPAPAPKHKGTAATDEMAAATFSDASGESQGPVASSSNNSKLIFVILGVGLALLTTVAIIIVAVVLVRRGKVLPLVSNFEPVAKY